MIETFLIDLPVMSLFGSIYALIQKRGKESYLKESAFKLGLLFSTIFIVSVLISFVMAPDWMWMYFPENPKTTLLDIIYLLIFLYYLPFIGGYILTRELMKKGWIQALSIPLISLLGEVFLIIRLWDRYSVVGRREEFLAGTAIPLWKSSVNNVFNIAIPLLVIIFLVSVFLIRRKEN